MPRVPSKFRQVSLIFVEGDTEVEFYATLLKKYAGTVSKRIFNLKGVDNVHGKVLAKTEYLLCSNKDCAVRVYCCIDRESREHNPPLDIDELRKSFAIDKDFKRVISADAIIATQMIESWYFHDVEGIFKFLGMPHRDRNPAKYNPPEKFNHFHLAKLFERYGKTYIKGHKSANFINNLDMAKIVANCRELKAGLDLIVRQAKSWENLLSP